MAEGGNTITTTIRSITMAEKQLTVHDLASYSITLTHAEASPCYVTAAYVINDGGYAVFKDHQHKIVAMARNETVAFIQRWSADERPPIGAPQ